MREIKFRAWDWFNKAMKFYSLKDLAQYDKFSYETEFEAIQAGFDNWKWMQFTGLKDTNGIDIYEGDIVTEGYNGKYGTFEVKWEKCGFNLETGGDGHFVITGNVYENIGSYPVLPIRSKDK